MILASFFIMPIKNIKRSITKSNLNFDIIIIPCTLFCLFAAYYTKIVNCLNCRWTLSGFQFSRPLWCVWCLQTYWGLDVFTVDSIRHGTNKASPRLKFIGSSGSQTSLLLFQWRPLHTRCVKKRGKKCWMFKCKTFRPKLVTQNTTQILIPF